MAEAFQIRDTLSGIAGAIALTAAGCPFDVVKIKMQVIASRVPASAIQVLSELLRSDGVLSLWRGSSAALSSALIENAVVFTANRTITRLVADGREVSELTFGQHALIGGASGVFSATAICPPEVVKCRLQAHRATAAFGAGPSSSGPRPHLSASGVLLDVLRRDGPRGLFAGLTPLLMRDVPFNTLFFGSYRVFTWLWDKAAASLLPVTIVAGSSGTSAAAGSGQVAHGSAGADEVAKPTSTEVSHTQAFLCGGFAGMAAWSVVFPFDVLKSRMQTAGSTVGTATGSTAIGSGVVTAVAGAGAGQSGTAAAASTLNTLRTVLSEGGVRAMYRGYGPAVARAFPANAALFWGVETADRYLRQAGL